MVATVGSIAVSLEADVGKFTGTFDAAGRTVDKFGRQAGGTMSLVQAKTAALKAQFATLPASLGTLARLGTGLAGALGVGVAVGGFSALSSKIVGVINDTDALIKSARKIGIGFESLQELRYGFDLAGVSAEETTASLQQFSRRVAEAASKGGELADVLKANGVSIRDTNGNIRPLMDLLRDYADLMRGAKSDAERLQLAQLGFGKSGSGMALALRDGARAIDDASKAAREAGVVLSEDLAPGVEQLNDDFAKLAAQIETGFKRAVLNSVGFLGQLKQAAADAANFAATGDRPGDAIARAAGAAVSRGTPRTVNDLWSSQGWGEPPKAKATVIPSSTIKTKAERDAVADLIKSLQAEKDLIGATDNLIVSRDRCSMLA